MLALRLRLYFKRSTRMACLRFSWSVRFIYMFTCYLAKLAGQANLVTGLINLSLQTMYISNPLAISILVMYTALIITATWLLRRYRLKM